MRARNNKSIYPRLNCIILIHWSQVAAPEIMEKPINFNNIEYIRSTLLCLEQTLNRLQDYRNVRYRCTTKYRSGNVPKQRVEFHRWNQQWFLQKARDIKGKPPSRARADVNILKRHRFSDPIYHGKSTCPVDVSFVFDILTLRTSDNRDCVEILPGHLSYY